ncbi:carboxypeptidase regulatory-like domain-containing protein [Pseudolysobacter antarcticus]|nr:carboxypeptidase regulatory-like domain-containing protein [Pseudolysobacter antarcticus]
MKHILFSLLLVSGAIAMGSAAAEDSISTTDVAQSSPVSSGKPVEIAMKRAGSPIIDLRQLPATPPRQRERPEREEPDVIPVALPGGEPGVSVPTRPGPTAPMPATASNFLGLDFANWGAGRPPDTVGDVGPTYFIQAVNTSIGIFRKSDSVRVAAFTFDTFMSQGSFGNLCDTDNFGDPVILYDSFEDRWVITDFAFQLDGSNNVINPPGVFQCIAVSKTGDPVTGGWNFYSLHLTDALNDYPKFGIWPDGIYMSANMYAFPSGGGFQGTRVWAFNKAQMYAGTASIQIVQFSPPSSEFTLLPANARLQTGTPPPGAPNYYSTIFNFPNAVSIYKFHVDWNSISLSTFTGPFTTIAPASWAPAPATVPAQGGNANDTLATRLMMQNQYTNIGGIESIWNTHTVLGGAAATSAPRYYQINVTGGTVAATTTQAATHTPDTTVNRYMPSLALDRAGDMALGYSASSAALIPAIRYAGRLAGDPVNTLPQTETSLVEGTGAQNSSTRWGDYSAMSLDPNGCTFWYTNEYYITTGNNWQTRVGSFQFPSCTQVSNGTLQGTVTASVGGAPISGATITFGSRIATTNGSGFYQFSSIPSGTYPGISASYPGRVSSSANSIVLSDATTTTQDFSLALAPTNACLIDTTQADLQTGVPSNVDLTSNPGDVILLKPANVDQQNTSVTNNGFGFTSTSWVAQTFTAGVAGQLTQVDLDLFCSICTGTTPNITISIRATSGATPVPTGADLAATTIPGSSAGGYFSATFSSPLTLVAGTRYAIVARAVSNPSAGTYAYFCSCTANTNPYVNGQRVTSTNSGSTWTADATAGGRDLGFRVYMKTSFLPSGNLISSNKDSNLATGLQPIWSTLSWNASTPANTALAFQIAASNSASGPFNFVGPDGTAGTFFSSSGASLNQFNGNRYLKYQADLSTTNNAATPVVNDVTVCYTAPPPPDLSLTKSDGGASVAPGGTVAYTLTYANGGGQNATGVVLSETVPANSTFNAGASTAGWVCTPNNTAGSACTLAIGTVNAGVSNQTATFAVTAITPIAAGVSQLSNTASIADDTTHGADPTPGNNSASDTTPFTGAPDLTISNSDGGASVAPGGTVVYTLTYANVGNRGAAAVVLSETVSANTTFNAGASSVGWVCTPNNNAGSTCTLAVGTIAAGSGNQTATFAETVDSTPSIAVAQISNTANIADNGANGTDPTPANNSSTDTTPISAADLSISNTDGVTSATPGGTVTYTITATNFGPSIATGATITDAFPAALTCNWTCAAGTGGGTCTTPSGTGNVNAAVNLPVNGSAVVTAVCSISAAATGSLMNTAAVAPPVGIIDPIPGSNSASDTDTLVPTADVALTITDNRAFVQVGDSLNYLINVSNTSGPSNVSATVTDVLPTELSSGSWVCTPSGGAACANGSGNTLSDTATLPVGSQASYLYSATVQPGSPDDVISNLASAVLVAGTDPNPANNSASDIPQDIIVIFKDGFEGTPLTLLPVAGNSSAIGFTSVHLKLNATLLQRLGIVPVAVVSGVSTSGKTLFTIELARFGKEIAARSLMTDAHGLSERSVWQILATNQQQLALDWQSASDHVADGYLSVDSGGTAVLASGHDQQDRLIHLLVTVDGTLPWMNLIAH